MIWARSPLTRNIVLTLPTFLHISILGTFIPRSRRTPYAVGVRCCRCEANGEEQQVHVELLQGSREVSKGSGKTGGHRALR